MAFNTSTLELPPDIFDRCQGISLDIGASLAKAVYFEENKEQNRAFFHFATFTRSDIDKCLLWLKEKWNPHYRKYCQGGLDLVTTGVGCYQFKEQIEETLNTRINNQFESGFMISAVHFLARTIPIKEFVEPPSEGSFVDAWESGARPMLEVAAQFNQMLSEDAGENRENDKSAELTDLDTTRRHLYDTLVDISSFADKAYVDELPGGFPAILAMLGSGTSFSTVHSDGSGKGMFYSSCGGKTLYGLARLLTGVQTFEEFMDLAKSGNNANVDHMNAENKTDEKDGKYSLMPDGLVGFSFGKAMTTSPDKFEKDDIAKALLCKYTAEHALNALLVAQGQHARTVFFVGTTIKEQLARDEISKTFIMNTVLNHTIDEKADKRVRHFFIKNGSYLGAIGALLAGSTLRTGL